MKAFFGAFLVAAAMFDQTLAHYRFTKLIINGVQTGEYQYVRKNTNYNSQVSVGSNDMRCNAGAALGAGTQTATVAAGATVGFALDQTIFHAGPLNVYISKAPGAASDYDGSGGWAKIYQIAPDLQPSGTRWQTDKDMFTFQLPANLAAGQYLVRIEQIGLHLMPPQFYISCAQIEVTGGGSAVPPWDITFPAGYTGNEPGLNLNIYYPVLTSYQMPGPAVWTGN
ncbi:hypothetical protein RUND412_006656 [Rhizina undulata]